MTSSTHYAVSASTLDKLSKSTCRLHTDLLIIDEWLIRCLTQQESYDLLEIIEARIHRGSLILCTQYAPKGWYERISPLVMHPSQKRLLIESSITLLRS